MSERGIRKTQIGIVVSDRMQKTVVVKVSHLVKHSEYNKFIKRSVKYKAHDELNACKIGDRVQIVETRPQSKEKHWAVKQILDRTT
jgi:small subunit ribosomal protein S17